MRAVPMTATGGPEVLQLTEVPEPDLRVQVGVTFPLEQAADAHRARQAGQVLGQAVLTMP